MSTNSGFPTGTAWERLQDGNTRFIEGRSTADDRRGAARRAELIGSQTPSAIVLGCADSRVPAEILFDQGLGDLFVVRTAGHTVDAAVLGSVEYAVAILGVPLIVVLGHDECGAISAAAQMVDAGKVPPGSIRDVVEHIAPDITRARRAGAVTIDEIVERHALYTVELLRRRSELIDGAIRRGGLAAVPARYCLSTGEVTKAYARGLQPA